MDVCRIFLKSQLLKSTTLMSRAKALVPEFSPFEYLYLESWDSVLWPLFWMEEKKCGPSVGEACAEGASLLQGGLGGRSKGKQRNSFVGGG